MVKRIVTDLFGKATQTVRGGVQTGAERLWEGIPERHDLLHSVDLPVYIIHVGPKPDDYFFVFDTESFMQRSRDGFFVRPRVQLIAGRDDFDRDRFGGYFRKSFAEEFEAMRAALKAEQMANETSKGRSPGVLWINLGGGDWSPYLSILVLALGLAVSIGRGGLSLFFPSIREHRERKAIAEKESRKKAVETEIDETRSRVDAALSRLKVQLHGELQLHAIAKGGPGDPDAVSTGDWPLPDFVSDAMRYGRG